MTSQVLDQVAGEVERYPEVFDRGEPADLRSYLDDACGERVIDSRQLGKRRRRRVVDVDQADIRRAGDIGPTHTDLARQHRLLTSEPLCLAAVTRSRLRALGRVEQW